MYSNVRFVQKKLLNNCFYWQKLGYTLIQYTTYILLICTEMYFKRLLIKSCEGCLSKTNIWTVYESCAKLLI
jgi:hypothetical protein